MTNLTQLKKRIRDILSVPHATSGVLTISVPVPTLLVLIDLAEKTHAFHSLGLAMDTADDTPIIDALALLGLDVDR